MVVLARFQLISMNRKGRDWAVVNCGDVSEANRQPISGTVRAGMLVLRAQPQRAIHPQPLLSTLPALLKSAAA